MEARWLIEAKFAPPAQIRRQIERTRILDLLAPETNRLIVIQAAAGFGKSTLLAQWTKNPVPPTFENDESQPQYLGHSRTTYRGERRWH